ncbi:MAG: hypothetical protein ACSHYA_11925 [Opitutaceae bacterium]
MATKKTSTPEPSKPAQINLGEVVNNYLKALQRIFDVMNYTLASERLLNEQEYENFSRGNRVMPSQQSRLDYEGARSETNTWLLKQTLNEALGVLVLFLDDCRTLGTLSSWKSKGGEGADLQKKLQEDRISFARLDLPAKLAHLEKEFELSSPSSEHILSLFKTRRVLANNASTVREEDLTDGKFTVKLRSVQLKTNPGNQENPGVFVTSEMGDMTREFTAGSKLQLNKQEHLATILTVSLFITSQAQSLKEYAQKLGVAK